MKNYEKKSKFLNVFSFENLKCFFKSVQTLIVNQMHKINTIIEKNM